MHDDVSAHHSICPASQHHLQGNIDIYLTLLGEVVTSHGAQGFHEVKPLRIMQHYYMS